MLAKPKPLVLAESLPRRERCSETMARTAKIFTRGNITLFSRYGIRHDVALGPEVNGEPLPDSLSRQRRTLITSNRPARKRRQKH